MEQGEGTRPDRGDGGGPRRVAVFVDYWWVYNSARQLFGGAGSSPAWFGNVAPAELARIVVKRPPAAVRRSERVLAGLHMFIRSYDPVVHHGQHERAQRWLAEGATVDVGPARQEGGGFWQGAVSVALAAAVVEALTAGRCDTAVVFAGDAALLPLFTRVAGPEVPSARIELATWVGPDGTVTTPLAAALGVWCHRLGETTFKHVSDDRRTARAAAKRRRAPVVRSQPAGPATSMAAAFAAAGLPGRDALDSGSGVPTTEPEAAEAEPTPTPSDEPSGPPEEAGEMSPVRRLTHRLFGRGA